MIVVLANYLSARQRLSSWHRSSGPAFCRSPGTVMIPAFPCHVARFSGSPGGMLFMSGASLRCRRARRYGPRLVPSSGRTSCATTRATDRQLPEPASDMQGRVSAYQSQIAVGSGGWFGKG